MIIILILVIYQGEQIIQNSLIVLFFLNKFETKTWRKHKYYRTD